MAYIDRENMKKLILPESTRCILKILIPVQLEIF
jgi:hypothetical protein